MIKEKKLPEQQYQNKSGFKQDSNLRNLAIGRVFDFNPENGLFSGLFQCA